jgi:membrane protease YdiL (CAAX protease family)
MIAAAAVVADMWLSALPAYGETPRVAVTIVAVLLVAALCRGDRASLGLSHRMLPMYRYWAGATLAIGGIVGLSCVLAVVFLHFMGIRIRMPATPPSDILSVGVPLCVIAPVLEEALYRVVLCVPLAAAAGPKVTIFVAGTAFAGSHFAHGYPGPDNVIAGYFLVWAFLKSGSVLTPMLLHLLGNACVLAARVIHWHLIS